MNETGSFGTYALLTVLTTWFVIYTQNRYPGHRGKFLNKHLRNQTTKRTRQLANAKTTNVNIQILSFISNSQTQNTKLRGNLPWKMSGARNKVQKAASLYSEKIINKYLKRRWQKIKIFKGIVTIQAFIQHSTPRSHWI